MANTTQGGDVTDILPVEVVYASDADTHNATAECLGQLSGEFVQLLIVFCGGKHDGAVVLEVIRKAMPNVQVVGGAAAGAITRDAFGYTGLEITMLAFCDPETAPIVVKGKDLRSGEVDAGIDLGKQIRKVACQDAVVLLFYDSVANQSPLALHPASHIVSGVRAGLGSRRVSLIGAGMLTDINMSAGWVFDGANAVSHGLVALVFPLRVSAETVIMHGCRPVSGFMTITKADGATIHELNGRPALTVLEEMLHMPVGGTGPTDLLLVATLGQNQGDPFARFSENNYVNRLILGADRDTGSITLFEPDFKPGDRVQVMSRDNDLMLTSVLDGVSRINASALHNDTIICALYFDCAGRACIRTGARLEEADVVRRQLDRDIKLAGFYSGVEIAPFGGQPRALDWTGVLILLRA